MKFSKVAVTLLSLLACPAAFGQSSGNDMIIESVPTVKKTSIELNPAAALVTAVPGIGAVSGSVEGLMGDRIAGFVEMGYADINLADNVSQRAEDESGEPIADKGYGYSVGGGLRYYQDIIGDSFYGSGSVSYSESKAKWRYNDDVLTSSIYTVTPAVTAGYRWVWQSGVLLRLGAGVGMPKAVGENISDANATGNQKEGRDKVADIQDVPALAKIDLGLGYTF